MAVREIVGDSSVRTVTYMIKPIVIREGRLTTLREPFLEGDLKKGANPSRHNGTPVSSRVVPRRSASDRSA